MTDDKTTLKRRQKEADLRQAEASAEEAELDLRLKKIELQRTEVSHGPIIDSHKGIFRLEDGVSRNVLELASIMQRWGDANEGKPLSLVIFSPGGSVMHGLALYDTLRTLSDQGHEITTVARGFVGSMGSVIFLAGDRRHIGAESIIHQHEIASGVGGKMSEINDEVDFLKRLQAKVVRIYASRTNLSERAFKAKITKKEWYAEATEALELGIATDVR